MGVKAEPMYIVGIDEAGRGPLAGPVAVGVAVVPVTFDWRLIPGVGDSKKLSHKKREVIFSRARILKQERSLSYCVSMAAAARIDRFGITSVVSECIDKALLKMDLNPQEVIIKLDGLLRAPRHFANQKTIVRGDESEKIIGLASILAKVTRDRYMVRVSKKYPQYSFELHKGYGTKKHCRAISFHGLCTLHRKTYTRNLEHVSKPSEL